MTTRDFFILITMCSEATKPVPTPPKTDQTNKTKRTSKQTRLRFHRKTVYMTILCSTSALRARVPHIQPEGCTSFKVKVDLAKTDDTWNAIKNQRLEVCLVLYTSQADSYFVESRLLILFMKRLVTMVTTAFHASHLKLNCSVFGNQTF